MSCEEMTEGSPTMTRPVNDDLDVISEEPFEGIGTMEVPRSVKQDENLLKLKKTDMGREIEKNQEGFVSGEVPFNFWSCIGGILAKFCGCFKDQESGLESQESTLKDQEDVVSVRGYSSKSNDDGGIEIENQEGVEESDQKEQEENLLRGDTDTSDDGSRREEKDQEGANEGEVQDQEEGFVIGEGTSNEISGEETETQGQEIVLESQDSNPDDQSNESRDFFMKIVVRGDLLQSEMLELLIENSMIKREKKKMQRDLKKWKNLSEMDILPNLDLGQVRINVCMRKLENVKLREIFGEASWGSEKLKEICENKLYSLDQMMVELEEVKKNHCMKKAEMDEKKSALDVRLSQMTEGLEENLEKEINLEKLLERATVSIESLKGFGVELEEEEEEKNSQETAIVCAAHPEGTAVIS